MHEPMPSAGALSCLASRRSMIECWIHPSILVTVTENTATLSALFNHYFVPGYSLLAKHRQTHDHALSRVLQNYCPATEAHSKESMTSARTPLSLLNQRVPSPHDSPALTSVSSLHSSMFRHDRPLRYDPVSWQVTVVRTSPARTFRVGSRSSGTCVDHFPFREACQNVKCERGCRAEMSDNFLVQKV